MNVYVIKERIQMTIADIVLDLIPLGAPGVSKKVSLEMMQLLGGIIFHNSHALVIISFAMLQEEILQQRSDYIALNLQRTDLMF